MGRPSPRIYYGIIANRKVLSREWDMGFEYYNMNEADNELTWGTEEGVASSILKVKGGLRVKAP